MSHSSRSRNDRPAKPYPDFPLFPHATRRWAKKIKGKFVFFGPWNDPHGALERYLAQRDFLMSSAPSTARVSLVRTRSIDAPTDNMVEAEPELDHSGTAAKTNVLTESPRGSAARRAPTSVQIVLAENEVTVRDLVNHFLTAKQRRVDTNEMGLRAFSEYHATGGRLVRLLKKDRAVMALTPDDFGNLRAALAVGRGPVALGNEIRRVRSIFKHGFESGLLERPMRFGPDFSKPSRRSVRLARWASRGGRGGVKMFQPAEIKTLMEAAGVQMRAMILLGLNCGMGNTDVSELPRSAIDSKAGMIDFPRPKTGIERRAVLWPETVAALRHVFALRPKPRVAEDADQVFLTKYGHRWVRVQEPGARSQGKRTAVVTDSVALECGKLLRSVGLNGITGISRGTVGDVAGTARRSHKGGRCGRRHGRRHGATWGKRASVWVAGAKEAD